FPLRERRAMKKSIMRGTLPLQSSVIKILDPIKKAGFDGIQLGVLEPPLGELSLRSTNEQVKSLAKACRDAGVEPHSIYLGIRFFYEEAADRRKALDDGKRVLEIAALLGARTWLIHPAFPGNPLRRVLAVQPGRPQRAQETS